MKEEKYAGEIKTIEITMSRIRKSSADNLSPENKEKTKDQKLNELIKSTLLKPLNRVHLVHRLLEGAVC
uniref:Uncharacterized protein n=1 Tax=Romanomermis culicivorax TaxID=13658 RepID=A0A915KE38_ROMCU